MQGKNTFQVRKRFDVYRNTKGYFVILYFKILSGNLETIVNCYLAMFIFRKGYGVVTKINTTSPNVSIIDSAL